MGQQTQDYQTFDLIPEQQDCAGEMRLNIRTREIICVTERPRTTAYIPRGQEGARAEAKIWENVGK